MRKKLFLLTATVGLSIVAGIYFLLGMKIQYPWNILGRKIEIEVSKGTPDDPDARTRYELMKLRDPATGKIPNNIRAKELAFAASLPKKETIDSVKMKKSGVLEKVQTTTWSPRGPYNVGGRTRALALDATNENILLAGGVSGGMWRSTNGGVIWNRTTDISALQSVTCITQDTRSGKSNTWYYGTGEYRGNSASGGSASYKGDGIFKSIDNGVSWSLLSSTSTGNPQSFDQSFDYVWKLITDPSNTAQDVIYAATYGNIYRSTNGGSSWNAVYTSSSSAYTDVGLTSSLSNTTSTTTASSVASAPSLNNMAGIASNSTLVDNQTKKELMQENQNQSKVLPVVKSGGQLSSEEVPNTKKELMQENQNQSKVLPVVKTGGQLPSEEVPNTKKELMQENQNQSKVLPVVKSGGQLSSEEVPNTKKELMQENQNQSEVVPVVKTGGQLPSEEVPNTKKELMQENQNQSEVLPVVKSGGQLPLSDVSTYKKNTNIIDPNQTLVLTATIYNATWSNTVDNDGDTYVQSARLNWDPDVVGGSGSLTVYEKIYYKLASSSTWTLSATSTNHTITGTSTSDAQYATITGGSHNLYDWRIEVYRSGVSTADYARDPSNDADLNDYKMELLSEDVTSASAAMYATFSSDGTDPGIFRSIDGITWTDITPVNWPISYYRIVIGIAPSNTNVVYFLAQTPGSGTNGHSLWKYTYISGDGSGAGGSWVNRSANLPSYGEPVGNFDSQGSYDLVIKVKPDNDNTVFIGGTNLYRSTDGFATTTNTTWIGGYSTANDISMYSNHHPDQHAIVFSPTNPSVMFTGNDGGVQKTTNDLANTVVWTSLNNGYLTSQFYSIAIDHALDGSNVITGGMQDNGTWFTNTISMSNPWINILGGDGAFCAIASGGSSYYSSWQLGRIYRQILNNNGNVLTYTRVDPFGGSGYLFINPLVLDPNNTNMMYLSAGDRVWRNSDLTEISFLFPDLPALTNWTELTNSAVSGSVVTALGVSKGSPANRLYYGTHNGRVYRLNDVNSGNPIPTDIWSGKGFPSGAYVSCIAVDPTNGDKAMVVFSNYNVQSLFYTTNGGTSWTAVSGNLEQNPDGTGNGPSCRWAVIFPYGGVTNYAVGTSTGLYSTTNLNGSSTVWGQEGASSIGHVVVDMIDVRPSDGLVVVATHGNGIYSTYLTGPLPIELMSFRAKYDKGESGVLLEWSTATESKNHGFDVERRDAGNLTFTWSKIVFVQGAGTSSSPHEYSYLDEGLASGRYAYRLKQINTDGTFTYSFSAEVEVLAPKIFSLDQNYPNPFNPSTAIRYQLPARSVARLYIYNMLGQVVSELVNSEQDAGYYDVQWQAAVASGIYFYRLEAVAIEKSDRRFVQTKKMLLLR